MWNVVFVAEEGRSYKVMIGEKKIFKMADETAVKETSSKRFSAEPTNVQRFDLKHFQNSVRFH